MSGSDVTHPVLLRYLGPRRPLKCHRHPWGPVGPSPEVVLPGVSIGFSRLGIRLAQAPGPLIVDAAIVKPAPHKRAAPVKRIAQTSLSWLSLSPPSPPRAGFLALARMSAPISLNRYHLNW